MARETSGTDAVFIRETAWGFFDPPIWHELPDNCREDIFFRQVGTDQAAVDDNDEDNDDNEANDEGVRHIPVSIPKLTSYREEALANLEDASFQGKLWYSKPPLKSYLPDAKWLAWTQEKSIKSHRFLFKILTLHIAVGFCLWNWVIFIYV